MAQNLALAPVLCTAQNLTNRYVPVWRDGSAPPRRTSRVRGVLYGAKAVHSGVQGDGGSRILRPQVTTQRPAVPQMLS